MTRELNCAQVKGLLWDFEAGSSGASARALIAAHLRECRECEFDRAEVRTLRAGLRSLPKRRPSPLLETRLRVLASHEHARQAARRDLAARFADWGSRAKLCFDNLLRPLAVPAAGGILASFLCFGVIVDNLHVHPEWGSDIPVGLYTQVTLDAASPFSVSGQDVLVQLTIDAGGQVTDFTVPQGNVSGEELQEIGNLVLYSTFTPATAFGQRVSGKILVNIHHINVRD